MTHSLNNMVTDREHFRFHGIRFRLYRTKDIEKIIRRQKINRMRFKELIGQLKQKER
jgi:hypothetical protein